MERVSFEICSNLFAILTTPCYVDALKLTHSIIIPLHKFRWPLISKFNIRKVFLRLFLLADTHRYGSLSQRVNQVHSKCLPNKLKLGAISYTPNKSSSPRPLTSRGLGLKGEKYTPYE